MAILDDFRIRYDILKIEHFNGTDTYTVNELYTAVLQAFDDFGGMDDIIPMAAQTPSEYTLINGWFIDDISITYLTGGAITTILHARVQDSNTGIVHVARTGNNITVGDIGLPISHADGDTGILLDINGGNDLIIRPTNNTNTHNWNSLNGNITCNGNIDVQNGASTTGETVWANPYSLGTIAANTYIYIVQNGIKIPAWWPVGHINVLIEIRHVGALIDSGYLTIFARQYSMFYDAYELDSSSGGRIPIPLSTSEDINNTTGYALLNCSGGTALFTDGEEIGNNATQSLATVLGVITDIAGTQSDPDLSIYNIGHSTDPFTGADTIYGYTSLAQADVDAVSDTGPTDLPVAPITITFGQTQEDIGDGDLDQPYDVAINCGGNLLADVYEHLKYLTRHGNNNDIDAGSQTIKGEQYITPGNIRIPYDGQTGTFTKGLILTGQISNATGIITAVHDTDDYGTLIVRTIRGTFDDTSPEEIRDSDTGVANINETIGITTTTIIKGAPFGNLAGVKFFGARGVWIYNVHADDANNYSLIDSNNEPRDPPASVPITVSGDLALGDRVLVYRTSAAGSTKPDKTYMASHASANTKDSTTFTLAAAIPLDTPSAGILRVVDNTGKTEQRYSYTSYSGAVFSGIVKTFAPSDAGLSKNYGSSDTAYVPYIDVTATGSSASVSVQFVSQRTVATRVRLTGKMPYSISGTLSSTGYPVTYVLNPDLNA